MASSERGLWIWLGIPRVVGSNLKLVLAIERGSRRDRSACFTQNGMKVAGYFESDDQRRKLQHAKAWQDPGSGWMRLVQMWQVRERYSGEKQS